MSKVETEVCHGQAVENWEMDGLRQNVFLMNSGGISIMGKLMEFRNIIINQNLPKTAMPFYLKAKYENKTKKYIVHDAQQIDILQIKSNFTPKIPVNLPLIFSITSGLNCSFTTKSEHQLLEFLSTHRFQDKSTVKVEIEKLECHEQNQEPFYSDKEYNKIRSKSEEIQPNLITHEFAISADEKHLRHSMFETQSSLQEMQQFIAKKQNQLTQLRSDKRLTNLKSLFEFMKIKN